MKIYSCKHCNSKNIIHYPSDVFEYALRNIGFEIPINNLTLERTIEGMPEFLQNEHLLENPEIYKKYGDTAAEGISKYKCLNCDSTGDFENFQTELAGILYTNLIKYIESILIEELSCKFNADFSLLNFNTFLPVHIYYLSDIIKEYDTKKYNKIRNLSDLSIYFTSPMGGPSSEILSSLLQSFGIGLITAFAYDTLKLGYSFALRKYNPNYVKEQAKRELENHQYLENDPFCDYDKHKIHPNLDIIIFNIEKQKRNDLIEELLVKHGMNLLEIYNSNKD